MKLYVWVTAWFMCHKILTMFFTKLVLVYSSVGVLGRFDSTLQACRASMRVRTPQIKNWIMTNVNELCNTCYSV